MENKIFLQGVSLQPMVLVNVRCVQKGIIRIKVTKPAVSRALQDLTVGMSALCVSHWSVLLYGLII